MSLRNKFLSILSLSLGIAVFSSASMAQETTTISPAPEKLEKQFKRGKMANKGFGNRGGKRGYKMGALRGLNLTDAQKAQIKAIRMSNMPDQAVITELRAIRDSRRAGTAITPEQKERMKAIREQRRANAKLIHEQFLAILTPEQKTQLETNKAERRLRMEQRKTNRKNRLAPANTVNPVI